MMLAGKSIYKVFFGAVLAMAVVTGCGGGGGSSGPSGAPPSAPTGVTAVAGSGQNSISWNNVSGATSYNLYWSTTSGVTKANGIKIANVTSPYTQKSLTNGTTYYYVVTAVNAYGESGVSNQVSATPASTAPPFAPTGATVIPGDGQNLISWNSVPGATSYNLYWSLASGVTKTTGTQIPNVTSPYVQTGLTNGTQYYYVVTAVNAYGESLDSSIVSATPAVITAVAAGYGYTVVLKSNGTVWASGAWNNNGQLGNNSTTNSSVPVQVCATAGATDGTCGSYLTGITAIAAGYAHTIALRNDGTVWTWGYNANGQLGNNSTADSSIPVQVCATAGGTAGTCGTYLTGITAIAAGADHTVALKSDGTMWAWGDDFYGQLGNYGWQSGSRTVPVQVCATAGATAGTCATYLTGITAIAAGTKHTAALKNDGTVWTWGYNSIGQLGNNTTTSSDVPVQVCGPAESSPTFCGAYLTGITALAAGDTHTLALKNDGTVWAWGDSYNLGNGSTGPTSYSEIPVQVCIAPGCGAYLTGITAISSGWYDSLALKKGGTLWAWGQGGFGQLGNNDTTGIAIPVQVCGTAGASAGTCGTYLTGITAISGGGLETAAVKNDNTVWAWGYNSDGELGNNSTTSSNVPVLSLVSSGTTIAAPSGLTATAGTAGSSTINMVWSASSGAVSYNVYWSKQPNVSMLSGTQVPLGNVTSYSHSGLTAGTVYYYVVTAVDSLGNESPGSAVATAVAQ